MSTLRKKVWSPQLLGPCPHWQRAVKRVCVDLDLESLSFLQMDWLFAVFASNGQNMFIVACSGRKYERWLASVERRSNGAADKYERKLRAHFKKYKYVFAEGYSLPAAPTPQLRVIYDSAARSQNRPTNPNGTTLKRGFDGGEYHWRPWPLNNVVVNLEGGAE